MKKLLCLSALIFYVFACCPSSATKSPTPIAEPPTQPPAVPSEPTDTPVPLPTETPIPTETAPPPTEAPPTETPPPEVLKPIVTATESNVNLRNGPGTDYEIVSTLSPGESLEIVGRNADSSWFQVSTPGGLAWVAASVVTASNVSDSIPVVEAPPPLVQPTDTPIPPADTPTLAPMPTDTPYIAPTSPPPAVECPYIGNSNTGKFHHFDCPSVDQMKEEHKVCLQSREEAIANGYDPCGRCNP